VRRRARRLAEVDKPLAPEDSARAEALLKETEAK